MARRIIPISVLTLTSLVLAFTPCRAQTTQSSPVAGISSQSSVRDLDRALHDQSTSRTSLEIVPKAQDRPRVGDTVEIPAKPAFLPNASVHGRNWTLADLGLSVRPATLSYIEHSEVSCAVYGRHIIREQIRQTGLEVLEVAPERPAARAGLRGRSEGHDSSLVRLVSWLTPTRVLGDFVVAADGKPVRTADDLTSILSKHKTADLQLSVVRVDPRGGTDAVTVTVPMTPPVYSLAVNTQ